MFDRPTFAQDIEQISGGLHQVPWVEVHEHHSLLSYRPDLRISIALGLAHRADFVVDWAQLFPDKHASSSRVDFRYNGVPVYRCSAYISVPYTQVKKACLAALPRISVKMLWLLAAAWYSGLIREDGIIVSANGAGGRLAGKLRDIRSAQG